MTFKPEKPPPRLIVVSYRGPVSMEHDQGTVRYRRGEGGLVSALDPVMDGRGGLWVAAGTPPVGTAPESPFAVPGREQLRVLYLSVSPSLHDRHYLGYSNRALWPLAHSFPGLLRFRRRDYQGYRRVNELFARQLIRHSRPGDLIWIHDYHFAPLPALIRAEAPDRRQAFFWHIPFPPYDVLRALPFHEEIVAGMLGSDAVHFHLPQYAENFREAAARAVGFHARQAADRPVVIGARPIGIDTRAWAELGRDPRVQREAATLRRQWGAEKVVLGVDRLDYTKGILDRILAVERLLERDPGLRGRFVLVQVAVPSRSRVPEYRRMRREIDETVGRINGRFSQGAYLPVRYYYRSYRRRTLCAFYRAADIGLVTPIRDGMNLVSMEFLMANRDRAPVLILSVLAGANELLDGALEVNPYDYDGVADAIRTALDMPEEERRIRTDGLTNQIENLDVHKWADGILEESGMQSTETDGGSEPADISLGSPA